MSNLSEEVREDINMSKFFDQETDNWRSKMIKIYGDQHPYTFYVTAGHDFEDLILKIVDLDAPLRESRKQEPFENLKKMSEVDRKAEKDFYKLLSQMEKMRAVPELKEALDEKKKECSKVFEMFDKIVSVCEKYFELEYADCGKRVAKQMDLRKPIVDEVEKFLIEIEECGNSELKRLRDRISQWVYNKGLSILNNADKSFNLLNDQPFAMATWFECSATLTSKELYNAFLDDQKEMNSAWKKAFDDLLMLSAKLEKCRCNHNMMKFKLESEIFWMNRDYKDNMPELTKIQRHLSSLVDEKAALNFQMKYLESDLKRERRIVADVQDKMHRKIAITKANNNYVQLKALKMFQSVLKTKKEEIYINLTEVLRGDQFIHEEILGVPWSPVDLSHLKPDDDDDNEKDELSDKVKFKTFFDLPKHHDTNKEEEFSNAFRVLISSENFVNLLNMMADEMGYILDFEWVNYIKEKLKFAQEVKWIELFKVFKIKFSEMKNLKEHMMSYCKFDVNKAVVFDIDGAIDGFLNYVWKKRQMSSQKILLPAECNPKDYEGYWSAAMDLLPKTLLWENVENILFQYWQLLEVRSTLLKTKLNLVAENNEYENYLENYHKYGSLCL